MKKIKNSEIVINDQYLIDNGYMTREVESRCDYTYFKETEKWRQLMDTCFRIQPDLNCIITEELIKQAIKQGIKRTPIIQNY